MTAVEFLENKLNDRLNHLSDHRIHIKEFVRTAKCAEVRKILEAIHKIKEMEKQQIINAYADGRMSVIDREIISYEQYYNETFNKGQK